MAFAAIIFGVSLGIPGSYRRALTQGHAAFRATARESSRRGNLAAISAFATLISGVALIFYRGGFGKVTPNFHIALTVMVVALAISAILLGPAVKRVSTLAEAETLDRPAIDQGIKRVAMFMGILDLLWTVMLTLMFVRWAA